MLYITLLPTVHSQASVSLDALVLHMCLFLSLSLLNNLLHSSHLIWLTVRYGNSLTDSISGVCYSYGSYPQTSSKFTTHTKTESQKENILPQNCTAFPYIQQQKLLGGKYTSNQCVQLYVHGCK